LISGCQSESSALAAVTVCGGAEFFNLSFATKLAFQVLKPTIIASSTNAAITTTISRILITPRFAPSIT
jgi:hypothetical protein